MQTLRQTLRVDDEHDEARHVRGLPAEERRFEEEEEGSEEGREEQVGSARDEGATRGFPRRDDGAGPGGLFEVRRHGRTRAGVADQAAAAARDEEPPRRSLFGDAPPRADLQAGRRQGASAPPRRVRGVESFRPREEQGGGPRVGVRSVHFPRRVSPGHDRNPRGDARRGHHAVARRP